MNELEGTIIELVEQLEQDSLLMSADAALNEGMEPLHLLDLIAEGMVRVGKLYETREYFIADLIMAGIIFKDVLNLERMKSHFKSNPEEKTGRVMVGTVKGDIHDIGKDIFKGMLEANGFEVIDLGVDVPKEAFVRKFKEYRPQIIGLSGVLTTAIDPMKETIEAFKKAGIREEVKFIVGGNHLTEDTWKYIGADSFANDVSYGVKVCKEWMGAATRKEVN